MMHSGFRKTTGQPASGVSLWYQPLCLPGNAEVVQCGADRAGGKVPVAAASLAKSSLGETKDSWVRNSKVLPQRLSFGNSGHAKQQLEGALGIWVWPDNSSFFFFYHRWERLSLGLRCILKVCLQLAFQFSFLFL